MIDEGKAYADDTPDGVESKRRNTSVEENRRIFKEMIEGKSDGYCLRAKIDMFDCNKAMRDPVIFR